MMRALFLVALTLVAATEAHVYTRCELAQSLVYDYGFPQSDMGTWVCICEHESSLNTAAEGPPNSDGSQDFGIFQINSYYWCAGGPYSTYNSCGLDCNSLLNDDIGDDSSCAWLIYTQDGFSAWTTYGPYCAGDTSSYVDGCF